MKFEANVEKGDVIVRELTTQEIAQDEIDRQEAAKRQALEDALVIKKQNALDKLQSLGLTSDDLKALGL